PTTKPAVDSLSPRPACARRSDDGPAACLRRGEPRRGKQAERSSAAGRPRSGEGQGEGISKKRDNSMERAPLPSPLLARASQGEGPLQRWWVYQDAPENGRPTFDRATYYGKSRHL